MKANKVTSQQVKDALDLLNTYDSSTPYNQRVKHYAPTGIVSTFNALIKMIQETNASITITDTHICLSYSAGTAKWGRNELTDHVLIPAIQ